jgi:hypothetical protein
MNSHLVIILNKKIITLIILLVMLSTAVSASSAITVGVKKGDWIEYDVSSTGTLTADHNITHARMEVLDVQGMIVQINILSTLANGTHVSTDSTLNLETGQLIDNFIIPAGLGMGNQFNSNMGRMMIGNRMQQTYCGAMRAVVTATSGTNTYIWDQATGVSVEGTSTGPNYTMHSLATATNMWASEAPASDMTLVYMIIIVAIVVIITAIVAVLAVTRRKK